jgi:MarR family transcriptional regulator for hemolysin
MIVPLGRQLALTSKVVKAHFDAVLTDHGASLTTWIVLVHANRAEPPGLSQRALADDMEIGGPALVRHIDRLENEGLVARNRDGNDRRVTRITLTPKGRRLLKKLGTVAEREDQRMRAELSATETRALERALAKLHAHALRSLAPDPFDKHHTRHTPDTQDKDVA